VSRKIGFGFPEPTMISRVVCHSALCFSDRIDSAKVSPAGVTAPHRAQDPIAARLHGQVNHSQRFSYSSIAARYPDEKSVGKKS